MMIYVEEMYVNTVDFEENMDEKITDILPRYNKPILPAIISLCTN